MNQDKIGKFILKLRKEKNMTQQELADKLGVTDRAISHWENGRSIPDVALFKSICEVFDISVNELMSGERKNKEKVVKEKKKSNVKALAITMTILFSILFILLVVVLLIIGNKSAKIDLYNFTIASKSDDIYELKKEINIDNRNLYYYGIESALFCNKKEDCYQVKDALIRKQITLDGFRDYLEKQVEYGNYKIDGLYDGGTTFYYKDGVEIIFCNTLDGNRDVYIGIEGVHNKLEGEFCGKKKDKVSKRFIRTYKVISSETNKKFGDLNNITFEDNKGNRGTALLGNNYVLLVGHTYEFTFITHDKYKDTIDNIFKNSVIWQVVETDKEKDKQINEEMVVDEELDNYYELFELKHVGASIDYDTLTNKGVRLIITDFSNNLYTYGISYRIDKYENDAWKELKNNCPNNSCDWTLEAYSPDQYGHLYFNINWEDMYGKLEDGKYRIVKAALRNDEDCSSSECNAYYFSVEFFIK